MRMRLWLVALATIAGGAAAAADPPAAREKNFLADPDVFPIAVWLQSPANAADYKAIGINIYVGLWRGPTEEQLADLEAARDARSSARRTTSAASTRTTRRSSAGCTATSPTTPSRSARARATARRSRPPRSSRATSGSSKADPSRPVLLNLGQGVAWDELVGRGVRTQPPGGLPRVPQGLRHRLVRHLPGQSTTQDVAGKLWYVADGVEPPRGMVRGTQAVWNCIEMHPHQQPEAQADAPAGQGRRSGWR